MFSDDLTQPILFLIQEVQIIPEPIFLGSMLKAEKPSAIPFVS